jgi:hypothetical protein
MNDSKQSLDVPEAQFVQHVIELAHDGDVHFNVNDEVREKISLRDVLNTSNHIHTNITEDRVELGFETTSSVSERTARRTHNHPAEYEHHDVTVHGMVVMEWSDGKLPLPDVFIEQAEYPTDPTPNVDVNAHRYDL